MLVILETQNLLSYLKNLKKKIFIDCYDPRVDQEELKKQYNVSMKKT